MVTAIAIGSPTNSSDLLHNHAPDPGPGPVYPGSRTQESAYQDYLAQFAQTKKDKEMIGGSTALPKFEGNYGGPDGPTATFAVNAKKKSKKRPITTPGPSSMYDYGYSEDAETAQGKSFYSPNGKQKYSFGDNKEHGGTHGYYASSSSSLNRIKRPYESSYYEPADYEDGYYQAEASSTQQQTAQPPSEGPESGSSLSKGRPSHSGHKGKIVNSIHGTDQIKASASEYYGGYGNGYSGGYDDFHHAYGGGSYHHVPYRPSHHRSSKGPLALLLGLLPLGLLFASLVPSFYNVPFAAIPPGGIPVQNIAAPPVVGRRRREIRIEDAPRDTNMLPPSPTIASPLKAVLTTMFEANPVLKALQEDGLRGLGSSTCIQRLACETLTAQPWMQTLAKSYDASWAEPLGLKALVDAIVAGKCEGLQCVNEKLLGKLFAIDENHNANLQVNNENLNSIA